MTPRLGHGLYAFLCLLESSGNSRSPSMVHGIHVTSTQVAMQVLCADHAKQLIVDDRDDNCICERPNL